MGVCAWKRGNEKWGDQGKGDVKAREISDGSQLGKERKRGIEVTRWKYVEKNREGVYSNEKVRWYKRVRDTADD